MFLHAPRNSRRAAFIFFFNLPASLLDLLCLLFPLTSFLLPMTTTLASSSGL